MQLFYTPDIKNDYYTFSKEESRHCIKVLRKKNGDQINLTDGKGNLFIAQIFDANPKSCKLEIIDIKKEYQKSSYYTHIAIAPTKNIDRLEWFLEKATEIGVNEITPIICQRSERKTIKKERLNKIIIAAIKQSARAYIPKLNPAISLNEFTSIEHSQKNKFIANCFDQKRKALNDFKLKNCSSLILIGPEGDFSKQEVTKAQQKGFISVSLGNSRLRTETAGIAACHTINLHNQ
jgi:16S rRNA (uracil1498-N3)-methyltransferase